MDLENGGWKNYGHIDTSSLWLIPKRDNSLTHKGDYHGNFVPQIPRHFIERFTKPGDTVLDMFVGSGTSMIECKHLGRNGLGLDINEDILEEARNRVSDTPGHGDVQFLNHDAHDKLICDYDFDLVFLHPPYADIVRYNPEDDRCLSYGGIEDFFCKFGEITYRAVEKTKKGGHIVLVIGDTYKKGAVIRLSSRCADDLESYDCLKLKSVIVKDMHGNEKGKGKNANLWRYRHLKNGTYDFSHEYIFLFRKVK